MGIVRQREEINHNRDRMVGSFWRWYGVAERVRHAYRGRFSEAELTVMIRQTREEDLIRHQEVMFEDDFYAWLGDMENTHYCIDQTQAAMLHGANETRVEEEIGQELLVVEYLAGNLQEMARRLARQEDTDLLDRLARVEHLRRELTNLMSETPEIREDGNFRRWAWTRWATPQE